MGVKFLTALAHSTIQSLRQVTINREQGWFEDREECMAPLIAFLAKQTSLDTLTMEDNRLSKDQKSNIRQTITDTAPNCRVDLKY